MGRILLLKAERRMCRMLAVCNHLCSRCPVRPITFKFQSKKRMTGTERLVVEVGGAFNWNSSCLAIQTMTNNYLHFDETFSVARGQWSFTSKFSDVFYKRKPPQPPRIHCTRQVSVTSYSFLSFFRILQCNAA